MSRLFVAVWPPQPVLDQLEQLPRAVVRGVRWTRSSQWHVTLAFLGDVDEAAVDERLLTVRSAAASAELGPQVEMLGDRVVVVPVSGLDSLADQVRGSVATIVPAVLERPFLGHVTVARCRARPPEETLGVPLVSRFEVGEFTLVRSELHPEGARHEIAARYPLG